MDSQKRDSELRSTPRPILHRSLGHVADGLNQKRKSQKLERNSIGASLAGKLPDLPSLAPVESEEPRDFRDRRKTSGSFSRLVPESQSAGPSKFRSWVRVSGLDYVFKAANDVDSYTPAELALAVTFGAPAAKSRPVSSKKIELRMSWAELAMNRASDSKNWSFDVVLRTEQLVEVESLRSGPDLAYNIPVHFRLLGRRNGDDKLLGEFRHYLDISAKGNQALYEFDYSIERRIEGSELAGIRFTVTDVHETHHHG